MYSKKMLRMLAGRYLQVLSDHGAEEATKWEERTLKGDKELVKAIIPFVHELQRGVTQ